MLYLENVTKKWKNETHKPKRVIAFGSSNTELHWHSLGHFNWFSWLSSAMREWIGRHITTINQGIGGETARDLSKRIERDVISFNPDLVIVTIGGNDTWKGLAFQEYEDYLIRIIERIKQVNALPVLQTYYCLLYHEMDEIFQRFPKFVEINRKLSKEMEIPLIDQYKYFSPFYENNLEKYSEIMLDGLHVNPIGNAIMGVIASRLFSLPDPYFRERSFWEKLRDFIHLMERYHDLPLKVPYPDMNND
ncbi:MAG: SGNH/GDSL hydrolase family protein [Promethearchaeota archaeon]|jgi:lysophospholipase L1-like esterase